MAANGKAGGGVRRVLVAEDRSGQRLDNFLLGQLKGAPRSLIYRICRTGEVRINGKRAKPDSRISGGDEIRIPPVRLSEEGDKPAPSGAAMQRLERAVVFEDRWLLALDKPSGVASHGGSGISHGAIEMMRAARPGETLELVHRLDRDTSGVLIIAKKRSALSELQALMREGGMDKRYLALLVGNLRKPKVSVDAPLQKSILQGGERMVRVDAAGKDSLSHFKVIDRPGGHSYVEVKIDTGRTHQIRVHAQHLGHPVAGDEKYGDAEANRGLKAAGLRRLFLHAASLQFQLETSGERYVLNAPLPAELKSVLDRLAG
ncbi:RluA family pseudouridine synthase [Pseudomarimonas salicorniae]|uniref:Pseudouridine synthase n=1 Tax=Pseudomarimonas salicorniae TaxID=2933270 RepID=A0ABT0GKP0_9GAMM|nr:RluA family pseudouridine synthase [Lysobacter sp. CAU 1642]MCK7594947.1 RluA family pseudouridine synthase [Lysobacter sp. CAU 1642]